MPDDTQKRADDLVKYLEVIRTEAGHVTTPQRDYIWDARKLLQEPCNRAGRHAKKGQGGIGFMFGRQPQYRKGC